jgi:hypothetical protein
MSLVKRCVYAFISSYMQHADGVLCMD